MSKFSKISVWADVGGTFTDVFVNAQDGHDLAEPSRRLAAKTLSSGLVYARVERTDDDVIVVDALPGQTVDGFWNSATWTCGEICGAVKTHRSNQLRVTGDWTMISPISPGDSLVLNAGIEAPVLATRWLLEIPLADALPPLEVRLGTTRGTNALLTRSGARTALITTKGFGDCLRIGEQNRQELFSLRPTPRAPLPERVIEVDERIDAAGNTLVAIDKMNVSHQLQALRQEGLESVAICLLHAHTNPEHERLIERIANKIGFANVSRSSEVAPLIKLLSRAETTSLDAYLNPILSRYTSKVLEQFGPHCDLRLMTSNGNLVTAEQFRGRDSVLSGPAGGVVALGRIASGQIAADRCADRPITRAIGLDMGGTSTDVSRYEGHPARRQESILAGQRIMTPMMDIHTVAAGGGSICDFRDGRLVVGPESAGAMPGPACYGQGGPLTVTDVNLLLGRLPEEHFPFKLDRQAAQRRLEQVHAGLAKSYRVSLDELAEGFLRIANTHMAEAVRKVSTAEGSDVRTMTLLGFGGAAGGHLCQIAELLGIEKILDHPDAAMLSALGIGLADVGTIRSRGIYQPLAKLNQDFISSIFSQLEHEARSHLPLSDLPIRHRHEMDLRYEGTNSAIALLWDQAAPAAIAEKFHAQHQTQFGYQQPDRSIEVVAVRCESTLPANHQMVGTASRITNLSDISTCSIFQNAQWCEARSVPRSELIQGQIVNAPTLITSPNSTLIVETGWRAVVKTDGMIELRRTSGLSESETQRDPTHQPKKLPSPGDRGNGSQWVNQSEAPDVNTSVAPEANDPVLLEVIARRLQGIADTMGETLRRTAISVNIKERRDYSCAVFRRDGALVANAAHVPVHLGAMGHTVRHIMQTFPKMCTGDCYVTNDPFAGGSHLPDVTLVTPVFVDQGSKESSPDFFVASRAHHAEIGGMTPGSMPPAATCLAEEGVVIRPLALICDGEPHFDELEEVLRSGMYPSRNPLENIADLRAQIAAGAEGVARLRELSRRYSVSLVDLMMERLLDVADHQMVQFIKSLDGKRRHFEDVLDDGTRIGVAIGRDADRLQVHFDPVPLHRCGYNATPAIVTAATLYGLRCLCQSDLPLCDGVLRHVDLKIPAGMLNPPRHDDPQKCAAVVAGNVETSQRIVDVLLGAFGVAAASQGTMNNVLIGDATFGYYETIGGGVGATMDGPGIDGVHSHMTNTRITDPEVVETRLPIRLTQFALRSGSGGTGTHRGGDGLVREFEFLKDLSVALLTNRRSTAPYGLGGGGDGQPGHNLLITSGETRQLPPNATLQVKSGDRLRIETPGGGGAA